MRLINADVLLKEFETHNRVYHPNQLWHITGIKALIENAQTIEAVPVVHGEWERIPYSYSNGYRCSCCGQKSIEKHWNFCPNCGANMRKKV